jgi:MFS transporter, SP family, major inositol transporter
MADQGLSGRKLVLSTAVAAVGACRVGFDLGVLNPCLEPISLQLNLSALGKGTVVAMLLLSAAVGALAAGKVHPGVQCAVQ